MNWLFASGGQSIGALASILPMNVQGWFLLGLTGINPLGLISLQSRGLSRVFSNTTVQKHQFFGAQPSSQSNSQEGDSYGIWRKVRCDWSRDPRIKERQLKQDWVVLLQMIPPQSNTPIGRWMGQQGVSALANKSSSIFTTWLEGCPGDRLHSCGRSVGLAQQQHTDFCSHSLHWSRGHTRCRGMWEWSLSVLSEEPDGNSKVSPSRKQSLPHTSSIALSSVKSWGTVSVRGYGSR